MGEKEHEMLKLIKQTYELLPQRSAIRLKDPWLKFGDVLLKAIYNKQNVLMFKVSNPLPRWGSLKQDAKALRISSIGSCAA